MAAGTVTVRYQSVDTFICDIVWLDADVTDTVQAHGLLGTPLWVSSCILAQPAVAPVYAALYAVVDATNLTMSKKLNSASSGCTVRYAVRRMHH